MGTGMFTIHNKVRGRDNRTQRATAPVHHRLAPRVGDEQLRLRRGRPLQVTEDFLFRNFAALKEQHGKGIIEVRSPSGEIIPLDQISHEEIEAHADTLPTIPNMPPPPLPNFPLDDAKRDKPAGQVMPTEPGYNLDESGNLLDSDAKPALLDLAPKETGTVPGEVAPSPSLGSSEEATLEAALQAAGEEEGEPEQHEPTGHPSQHPHGKKGKKKA